jgi:dTDP-4-dehydrorhamnose reductase
MLQKARDGQPVRAFSDRTVSPSYVPDVVRITLALLERGAPWRRRGEERAHFRVRSTTSGDALRPIGVQAVPMHGLRQVDALMR